MTYFMNVPNLSYGYIQLDFFKLSIKNFKTFIFRPNISQQDKAEGNFTKMISTEIYHFIEFKYLELIKSPCEDFVFMSCQDCGGSCF